MYNYERGAKIVRYNYDGILYVDYINIERVYMSTKGVHNIWMYNYERENKVIRHNDKEIYYVYITYII